MKLPRPCELGSLIMEPDTGVQHGQMLLMASHMHKLRRLERSIELRNQVVREELTLFSATNKNLTHFRLHLVDVRLYEGLPVDCPMALDANKISVDWESIDDAEQGYISATCNRQQNVDL